MIRMKKDAKICLIVTIAIIASIAISGWVFRIDAKTPLSAFGSFVALLLPVYVLHRIRTNRREDVIKYEVGKVVEECVEKLAGLAEDIENYEFEGKVKAMKYLDTVRAETESISDSLRGIYHISVEDDSPLRGFSIF